MGAVSFSEEENTGFFGPSSNIAFTRQIVRAVKATLRNQPLQPRRYGVDDQQQQSHMLHVSRPPSPLHQRVDTDDWRTENPISMALPPEDECMRLVHQYFGRTGVLFPYIHEESFVATYNSFKATQFRKVRRSWLGLLNMILAMATRTAVNSKLSAQEREEQSDTFFVRGWRLCEKQVKYSPSLEIVQFLLLLSQYLQGTSQGAETWNAHGLTVKSAYQLGLHSTDALKQYPPLEREIRKRTWYMCILLDRTLSMTFGRPFVIPASYIRVPLPEPYEMDASLPLGVMSSISSSPQSLNFFRATIRLFNSIWNIIDSLYGGNLGCGEISSVFDITSRLLHIEQELLEWQRTLPPDMTLVTHPELKRVQTETSLPLRFRVILTLRFNNIRILAHRPILVKFLDVIGGSEGDTQELSMLTQVGMDSVQTCVHSASTILEIVGYLVNAGEMRRTLLGAWWYTLYYTFNAALVIFSALLIKHISARSSARPIPYPPSELSKSFLRQAVDTLMALDNDNRMVEKCARYISKLYNILEQLETAPILPSNLNGAAHLGPISSIPNYANTILNPVSSNGNGDAQGVSPQDWGYMVPNDPANFGLDMNEFLVSGDLDLLGQMGGQNFL
ncbi:hypothetical protein, variant [Verruconis gallopava]|nr:hypothetical protein, variant [Verruconis gallopava]KIW01420.1 hypothetical protein, variant [Verruconis gallopava]